MYEEESGSETTQYCKLIAGRRGDCMKSSIQKHSYSYLCRERERVYTSKDALEHTIANQGLQKDLSKKLSRPAKMYSAVF
jgi:hypothetical protein